ncbi:MAG: UbiA family prenyltransferase [Thermoplasmatota archaeon]
MKTIKGIISIIRPEDGALGAAGVYIGWAVASGSFLPQHPLSLILSSISTFLLIGVLNIFNDIEDLDIDKLIHSRRAIASGNISLGFSRFYLIGLLMVSMGLAGAASFIADQPLILIIFFLGLLMGLLYELWLKKKGFWGNTIIALMITLPFLMGASIIGITSIIVVLCLMAFVTGIAKEVINDVKDLEGDKGFRITLPQKIGVKPSLFYSMILLIITILLSSLPVFMVGFNIPYVAIIGTADLILVGVIISSFYKPNVAHHLHSLGMLMSIPGFLMLSL